MTVNVPLGERAYDIVIGRGLLSSLGKRLAAIRPNVRAAIVTDSAVAPLYLDMTEAALSEAGISFRPHHRAAGREVEKLPRIRARMRNADRGAH